MAETLVSDALSSVERVEEFLSITATAEQRDVIIRMINGVTAGIHRHTGRKLRSRSYTPASNPADSIFNGEGRSYLYTPNFPITDITELSIELTKFREIRRRNISAVSATTLTAASFTFENQDAKLGREIVSVSPDNSTEETQAIITSILGIVATFSAGWSNGKPASSSEWWFSVGFYLEDDKGKIILSDDVFTSGNKNVRISYTAGYIDGSPELDYLYELTTSLVGYLFKKASKVGFKSETIGSYSYRLADPEFKDFWNLHDVSGLDQFVDWRQFL